MALLVAFWMFDKLGIVGSCIGLCRDEPHRVSSQNNCYGFLRRALLCQIIFILEFFRSKNTVH